MTFHPVTLGDDPIANIMDSTINCILAHDCNVFITYPNNDNGYKDIIKVINKWKKHEKVIVKRNLGAEVYYNAIDTSLFVIGLMKNGFAPFCLAFSNTRLATSGGINEPSAKCNQNRYCCSASPSVGEQKLSDA